MREYYFFNPSPNSPVYWNYDEKELHTDIYIQCTDCSAEYYIEYESLQEIQSYGSMPCTCGADISIDYLTHSFGK